MRNNVKLVGGVVASTIVAVATTTSLAIAVAAPSLRSTTEPRPTRQELQEQVQQLLKQEVEVYEDGSGVQYNGEQEVRTFPPGTFVYDSTTPEAYILQPTRKGV
jgi:hypothetical protein